MELESAMADLNSVIDLLTSDAEPQRPRVVQGGS